MRAVLLVALIACAAPEAPRPNAPTSPASAPVTPGPVAAPDPSPPALRLPGDVKPTKVALELTILPGQPTATGRVQITADVVQPTRIVWLNATDLTIDHAELDGKPARVVRGNADFIGLTVDRELPVGGLTIGLAFSAAIDATRSRGVYSEREGNDAYVYTFFEPIDARRAFPCFDEPSYKVPWQVTLHVRQADVALGNAAVVRETAEPGGMKKVELATTKPLPSYLVAFVVGPFELVDGGTAGRTQTPIRFAVPKGRAGELGYAKQVTPKVVVALEDYFDMAYPFGKLDVAVVPRYWGTMEHPGLVAMGQPLTLIRPDQETRERKRGYARILAHELSHYWFGDLVTMAWWDDTWLNEALGEWSDLNITEAAEPSWRIRDHRVESSVNAMTADETLSAQAIRQPVTTRQAIGAAFDGAITYAKGASMFRMFESFVGHDAWRTFIQSYLRAHAWGNASADDFLVQLSDNFGPATATAMRSFLEQPGVPRISARLRCEPLQPPRVWLSQQRSLPFGVSDPSPKLWSLPVCLRYGDAKSSFQQCVSLSAPAVIVDLSSLPTGGRTGCPTWMILNADAVGYYRSVVDPKVVRALLTPGSPAAKSAKPTPAERMMLVDDLRAAVSRDELGLDKLLELLPVIAADADDKVARRAVAAAAALPLAGLDEPTYAAARRWLHKTFRPRALQLGWRRGAKDTEERHELRQALMPLAAVDDPALTAEAARLVDRWLADRSGLADDLVVPALVTATRDGDAARFARYVAAEKTARDRSEHRRLLGALGMFADPTIAEQALAIVLRPEVDLRDSLGIVHRVLAQRETRDVGLGFLDAHLDELLARMRDDEASWFLGAIAGAFCDPGRRAKAAALVEPRAARFDGAEARVARSLEQADQCIVLVQRQLPSLRRALDAK
jgi:aminopeptidase N